MTDWHRTFDGLAWRTHRRLPLPAGPLRVLVTGSRTYPFSQHVDDALGFYWELAGPLTVVHGDAINGADRMAREWCERMNAEGHKISRDGIAVVEERHPADWSQGKGAGFARNAHMVEQGVDVCLAYADVCRKPGCQYRNPHPSHGVWDCSIKASTAGVEVVRYQTWEPPVPAPTEPWRQQ